MPVATGGIGRTEIWQACDPPGPSAGAIGEARVVGTFIDGVAVFQDSALDG